MTHLLKFRLYPILKWVSSNLSRNVARSQDHPIFITILPLRSVYNNHSRFYGVRVVQVDDIDNNEGVSTSNNGDTIRKISLSVKREAQSALLEYLHSTRCLQFLDAEHMSKNSPHFLRKLIGNVLDEPDVGRSIARFLRYHPINEFEPFFESIGLDPIEFVSLLPRDLMFLSDEEDLLENFHVLCEYGIARNKVGKVFREARAVFEYGDGVLKSKIRAMEEAGLSQPVVVEAICSGPYILIGDSYKEFIKVVKRLRSLGYEYDWIEGYLLESTYNWRQIFELLCILSDFGCDNMVVGDLIGQHPELLFDGSGRRTFSLIGFLLKLGSTKNDICSLFLQFPSINVRKFSWNLRRVSELLVEIEMNAGSIGWIIRSHLTVLGTLSVKKANSILSSLRTGKRRLCDTIIANPLELKNWVLGARIEQFPDDDTYCHAEKIKFLLRVGFEENSAGLEKALKLFRGRGDELQERFDCLVRAGLCQKDVARMIKGVPQILNQSKGVIESKIDMLVNDLGYPVSALKTFPGFICYTTKRVKLRYSMYKWLSDQRAVHQSLSLSTFVACSENYFMRRYVKKHPRGPEVWQELKKTTSSA